MLLAGIRHGLKPSRKHGSYAVGIPAFRTPVDIYCVCHVECIGARTIVDLGVVAVYRGVNERVASRNQSVKEGVQGNGNAH